MYPEAVNNRTNQWINAQVGKDKGKEMIEQAYKNALKHTHAYTIDDSSYHSCIVSDISEKPIIDYKGVYNSQNSKRSKDLLREATKKLEENDEESVLNLLTNVLQLQSTNVQALNMRGSIYYKRGLFMQAKIDFLTVPHSLTHSLTHSLIGSSLPDRIWPHFISHSQTKYLFHQRLLGVL